MCWVEGSIVFENVAFEEITDFVEVPAGTYNVQVVPSGATMPVVIEADLDLAAATDYTVIATDFVANITPVILTADGGGPAAGNVWVRFFHGSPDAPAVDIAVTGGPVLFANVPFQGYSDYIEVPAGTYDLEARIAGTMDVALALPGIQLEDGAVYTAYATGLVADIGALSEFYFIPAAARARGAQGAFFKTDLDIQNAGRRHGVLPVPVAAAGHRQLGSARLRHLHARRRRWRCATRTCSARCSASRTGPMPWGRSRSVADSPDLKLFSRTYNVSDAGTFGQAIPGFAASDLIQADERKRILFFTENGDFRSNIGILNGTGAPMTIIVGAIPGRRDHGGGGVGRAAAVGQRPAQPGLLRRGAGGGRLHRRLDRDRRAAPSPPTARCSTTSPQTRPRCCRSSDQTVSRDTRRGLRPPLLLDCELRTVDYGLGRGCHPITSLPGPEAVLQRGSRGLAVRGQR